MSGFYRGSGARVMINGGPVVWIRNWSITTAPIQITKAQRKHTRRLVARLRNQQDG